MFVGWNKLWIGNNNKLAWDGSGFAWNVESMERLERLSWKENEVLNCSTNGFWSRNARRILTQSPSQRTQKTCMFFHRLYVSCQDLLLWIRNAKDVKEYKKTWKTLYTHTDMINVKKFVFPNQKKKIKKV